jgi:hypothetical protein
MRLDHLPQRCYHQDSEGKLCLIIAGMDGYYLPIPSDQDELEYGSQWNAEELNSMLGVSPEEEDIMVGGSMFGWDTPLVQDYKPSSEYARHISKINADKILQDMEAEGL